MKIALDIDGVITANPGVFSWLTYHFSKKENDIEIFIISWRDGTDTKRFDQTVQDLKDFGIKYGRLIMAPTKFTNIHQAALWKIKVIAEHEIDIWFDDEIKAYKRDLGIDLDSLLPNVKKIWI